MLEPQMLFAGAICAVVLFVARFHAAREAVWKLQRAELVSGKHIGEERVRLANSSERSRCQRFVYSLGISARSGRP